jgi:hypothetical protein
MIMRAKSFKGDELFMDSGKKDAVLLSVFKRKATPHHFLRAVWDSGILK